MRWALFGVVLFGLLGCGSKSKPVVKHDSPDVAPPVVTPAPGPPPDEPATSDTSSEGASSGPAGSAQPVVRQQKPHEIAPVGKDGWSKADLTPEAFGRKVDVALSELQGAKASVYVMFEVPSGQGRTENEVLIQDAKHYRIEYTLPEHDVSFNVVVADGRRKGMMERQQWLAAKPLDAALFAPSDVVGGFATRFTKYMFAGIVDGVDAWARLLGTWSKPGSGHTLTIEKKSMPVAGEMRPYYRVVAVKSGQQADVLEARFDGTNFIPLTVRSHVGKTRVQWQARWTFGHTHDESRFAVVAPMERAAH